MGRKRLDFIISDEQLNKLLTDDNFGLSELAVELNTSKQTISSRIKELNRDDLKERMRKKKNNLKNLKNKFRNYSGRMKARELVLAGWKQDAIILECKVTSRTVSSFRKELQELL